MLSPYRPGSYRAGAHAEVLYPGTWRVWCNQCGYDLETMTTDTLIAAIRATVNRGGVLCPECRDYTCDGCGTTFPSDCIRLVKVLKYGTPYRLCRLCNLT